VSEFTALCKNPKAPLVTRLGLVIDVSALGSGLGAGSGGSGLVGVALALFAIVADLLHAQAGAKP
jgi:hypothetical protein